MTKPVLAASDGEKVDGFARDVTEPPEGGGGPPSGEAGDDGDPCPVTALGCADGVFVFATARGEVRGIAAQPLCTKAGILALFDGATEWLKRRFPSYDKDGHVIEGSWSHLAAAAQLMRDCAALPLWDAATPQRGRGVWPIGGAGDAAAGVLVHAGDRIGRFMPGAAVIWRGPGLREGGALYRAMPPVRGPGEAPAGPELAQDMLELLSMWRFDPPSGASVLAGWIAAATLGAAIPWRPHLLIVAPPGSGKTWLDRFIEACLPLALALDNFTEAGVRQSMQSEARPMLLDEAEGTGDAGAPGPVEKVIEMIRRLSDEGGLKSVRGSAGGQAQRFTANGAALLSAVLPPALLPQDATRFTRLDLLPLDAAAASASTAVVAGTDAMRAAAPALWARMIAGRGRYLANLRLARERLALLGCTPREADQPGAILAGLTTLAGDDVDDAATMDARIAELTWMVVAGQQAAEEAGPALCLAHLLSAQPDVWSGGARQTVGVVIETAFGPSIEVGARQQLAGIGIRVELPAASRPPEEVGAWIANRFGALTRIYQGTQWAGGRWKDDLRRLPGAAASSGTIRIGGAVGRATWLPLGTLQGKET